MKTKPTKKKLALIGFVICSIASTYLIAEVVLNWKSDFRDMKIPALWTMVTLQYYYNWKSK